VRHHYDVSNDFFALFLDESMTYSCALFSREIDSLEGSWGTHPPSDWRAPTLEQAQAAKRELICRKLALKEGERVLDVGCGWGSFVIHAAAKHGVRAVGITLSPAQAELARRRVGEAGLEDRVEVRIADYRELGRERYDAIASIGMVEHVGANQIDLYARQLAGLLEPGGLLLNHGIARLRHGEAEAGPFSERYVFPDAAPLHVSRVTLALERAGIEPLHVEGLREDYAETLSHWIERLDANRSRAEELAGPERVRVWRLYLRAARNGFRTGFTSIFQILGRRA
jgi:cyclopropane-fatty-acyl-phospholipid synthase